MKVHRKVITPHTTQDLVIHLPESFLNTPTEIIAIPLEQQESNSNKRSKEEAIAFFKRNAVDFSKLDKWKREDLYD